MKWVNVLINGTEVSVAFDENSIHIYNAFPIKDGLKLRGYRWNPQDKSWQVFPSDVNEEIAVLKNNLQPLKKKESVPFTFKDSAFPQSYSVIELRNLIDRLIHERIPGQIWIRGVVASEIKNYKWASYFDLRDEDEKLALFFRVEVKKNVFDTINRKLKETGVSDSMEKDLPVFCQVEVQLSYRNVVDLRLILSDILPEYTQAKIRNQREITLEKLQTEGVLENQKKLEIPLLATCIGLITSGQGTSSRDILAGLSPYEKKYQFYFIDTRMEGANAIESLIRSIDHMEKNKDVYLLDAIVIARGGGSEQSLAVFNDYRLCRRICDCQIPVITAIGHDKDVSAIERCSHFTPTPSTPSGVGEYLLNRYVNLNQQLSDSIQQLMAYFLNVHNREIEKLKAFAKNLPSHVIQLFKLKEERFFSTCKQMEQSVSFTVRDHKRRIEQLMKLLFSSGITLFQRERLQFERAILKFDFKKRFSDNQKNLVETKKNIIFTLNLVLKSITRSEEDLRSRTDLILANDPALILKRGFTLTLDEKNQIIKSLKEFRKIGSGRLRFHDGTTGIKEKEEK